VRRGLGSEHLQFGDEGEDVAVHGVGSDHINADLKLREKILAQNHAVFEQNAEESKMRQLQIEEGRVRSGIYQPKPPKAARFFPVTDENLGSGLEGTSSNKNMLQKMEQQWGNLRKAFRAIDKDSSGTIDANELEMLLDRFNIHDASAEEIMAKYDKDGSGSIDYQEFMDVFATKLVTPKGKKTAQRKSKMMSTQKRHELQSNLSEAAKLVIELFKTKLQEMGGAKALTKWFRAFDQDGNGQIQHAEFQHILEHFDMHLADETIHDVLLSFDADHDGSLEYDEFVEMVQDSDMEGTNLKGIGGEATSVEDAYAALGVAGDAPEGEDEEQDFFARTRGAKVFEMDEDEKLAEDPVMNAALTARANHRVEKQMMELLRRGGKMKKLFRTLDEDRNGQLSTKEFMKGMTAFMWEHGIHVRKEGMERLVAKLDADKDGRIE
jgi:Ca2+-binding EF-hand superfamily protein